MKTTKDWTELNLAKTNIISSGMPTITDQTKANCTVAFGRKAFGVVERAKNTHMHLAKGIQLKQGALVLLIIKASQKFILYGANLAINPAA
ncbi:MAG TPA: hypothetical protein PK848_06325 [Caldisericia bacterium]|nr:hypothetical protein [Caldisericia bacterium]HQN37373.1 hypothetical protein [Caldisericia bacterium]